MKIASVPVVKLLLVASATLTFSSAAHAKVKIAATLPSLASIAQEVGGDLVEVDALAAATQDPHFVDAKPNLVLKLNQADLVVYSGMELEIGWLPPLLVQARNAKIGIGTPGNFDASSVVTRKITPAGKVDRAMGDVHPQGNPHYLFDARAAVDVVRGLGNRLAEIDAANAAKYKQRAALFADKLAAFAGEQHARFTLLPEPKRHVVTYHESFPYLLEWLGLEAVAFVEPKPGIPPDPGHVAQVLQIMKARGATSILQEEYYPTSTSKTLAGLTGATLVSIHGSPRISSGETYFSYLKKTADDIYAALTGKS